MIPTRTVLGATVWLAVLAVLAGALIASGHRVGVPTGWTLTEIRTWFEHQPVTATFRLASLGALILVLYLMVSTVAVLMAASARAARLPRLGRLAEIIATPALKRALSGLLGLGITLSTSSATAYAGGPDATAVAVTIDEQQPRGVATMRALGPEPAPVPAAMTPVTEPTMAPLWTIEPGDHLWGLAEAALTAAHGRAPTDAETTQLVHDVVELNRDTLVVPGHPDLVLPGQVFVLPPLP
jgi:hypothetical protein